MQFVHPATALQHGLRRQIPAIWQVILNGSLRADFSLLRTMRVGATKSLSILPRLPNLEEAAAAATL